MIGWELPPFNSGGLGVACLFMAEALARKTDLTFSLPKKFPIDDTNFLVIFADDSIKSNAKNFSAYMCEDSNGMNELFNEVESYGERLYKVIQEKELSFDLIHAHDWLSASAAIYLKKKLNIPAIIHIHATEIERTGVSPNFEIYDKEKKAFEQSDALITVSHQTREIVYQHYGISRDKIFAIPNGIDLKIRSAKLPLYLKKLKQQGYKLVLFVGRFALQKGPDYFLETLPLVKSYIETPKNKFFGDKNDKSFLSLFPIDYSARRKKISNKVRYIFCGSGEMMGSLVSRASELNVLNDVIFSGFLRNNELWGIYQIADVLVVPSVFDPFGLVPLEGVKYKTPVIISKTTGVGDYLINVLKSDFWDTKKMANLIISALKYPEMSNELARTSYQELEKFRWEDRTDKILSIYQGLKI